MPDAPLDVDPAPAPEPSAPLADLDPPSPLARIQALGQVVFCSGFVTQPLIGRLLLDLGLSPVHADGSLSLAFVSLLSFADTAVLLGLIWWFLRRNDESPRAVLFGHRPWTREAWLGVLLLPVVVAIVAGTGLLVRYLWPSLHNVPQNPLQTFLGSATGVIVLSLVAVVAGGVREEVQRAFIIRRFESFLGGALVGVLAFGVLFGAGHLLQGRDAAIVTGLLGIFWGLAYLRRGSIVAPLVSHALFNLLQINAVGSGLAPS